MTLRAFDAAFIRWCQRVSEPASRLALFIVFFWFGALKLFGQSPATPLVHLLFERTISVCSFDTFIILFGIFECLIGVLFLFKGMERVVILLLVLHMITTFMPLFLLPSETWSGFLVPTLEGQYIIKNVVIIAAAIGIAAHLQPLPQRTRS